MSRSDAPRKLRAPLNNLQLRVLSGIVLGAVAVVETWAGGVWFELFCIAIGVVVFAEWCVMTRHRSDRRHQLLSGILFAVVVLAVFGRSALPLTAVLTGSAACAAIGLFFGRWRWTAAGFLYSAAFAMALAAIRGSDDAGLATIILLFAVVWTTDIMAYFVGRLVGGPKLAPMISPGKTWSGALGGAAFSVGAGLAAGWALGSGDLLRIGIVSLLLSAVAQAGDLFESWIKRRHGVKDSSRIIPGHGGVMDRVDGLVAAAIALYIVGAFFGGSDDVVSWLFPSTRLGGL